MGFIGNFFKKKEINIPQKPSIENVEGYILWLLEHGEQWKNIKNLTIRCGFPYDKLIPVIVEGVKSELNKYQDAYALLDRRVEFGEGYEKGAEAIEKRGGISQSPSEVIGPFVYVCAMMVILPHFIHYKFGLDLPKDVLEWRPC